MYQYDNIFNSSCIIFINNSLWTTYQHRDLIFFQLFLCSCLLPFSENKTVGINFWFFLNFFRFVFLLPSIILLLQRLGFSLSGHMKPGTKEANNWVNQQILRGNLTSFQQVIIMVSSVSFHFRYYEDLISKHSSSRGPLSGVQIFRHSSSPILYHRQPKRQLLVQRTRSSSLLRNRNRRSEKPLIFSIPMDQVNFHKFIICTHTLSPWIFVCRFEILISRVNESSISVLLDVEFHYVASLWLISLEWMMEFTI